MSIFGTSCPPPFYHNSRELRTVIRIREKIAPFGGNYVEWSRVMVEFDAEQASILMKHLEEHRAEVYRTFPGLTFFSPKPGRIGEAPDFDRREIVNTIRHSSLLTGERRRFKRIRRLMREAIQELPEGLPPEKAESLIVELQEKKLFETYSPQYGLGDMSFREFQRLTHEAIKRTRGHIRKLLDTYLPVNHVGQLEFAACVDDARDFPTLIALAAKPSGKGVISKRIGHEARVMAVLSQLEFEYLIGAYNPDRVEVIRKQLTKVFENSVFDPDESVRVVVVAELDPENDYRVKRTDGKPMIVVYPENAPEAHQSATATLMVLPLDARVVKHGGRRVLIYFRGRQKEMIWAKLLRSLYREPEHLTDHSGYTFVLFSNGEDEEIFANRLREKVVVNPGQVWAQASNAARAGAIDPNNPHSSVDRRGEKYIFRWGGINHEIQILDIATYIDSMVSRNRIAHTFYKYLTLVDTAFPFIWPKDLYGKDWLDAKFRDVMWEFLAKKLWTGHPDAPVPDNGQQPKSVDPFSLGAQ